MSTEPKTLQQAISYFEDADNCISYLAGRRWPDGVAVCPTCDRRDVSYVPARRVWQCKTRHPKSQFSIKVGTIFEDSPIPLGKWLSAMWMLANCKNGVSSWEVHRTIGVTQKTAWFMLHRIRLALQGESHEMGGGPDCGPVEVDETFVGGKVKNMHVSKRQRGGGFTGKMSGSQGKTIVMGILDRDARKVRAKVIPDVKRETLQDEILAKVAKHSTVYTDSWGGYASLEEKQFVHETVNHLEEYVRGQVHTNGIENFWSLLKRSLREPTLQWSRSIWRHA